MEYAKPEGFVLENVEAEKFEIVHRELSDFQLALVGGGCGEVIFG
jgi:hypothetical protein